MAALRNRLLELASGKTDLDAVVSTVEAAARESLADAETLLGELDEAYTNKTIDLESFSVLKKSVVTSITRMESREQKLDFDLSEGWAEPDDATLVSHTTGDTTAELTTEDLESELLYVRPGMLLRGRFHVDEVLGKGGMGTVYKGRDALKIEAQDRNPHIAIKVLNEDVKKRPDAFIALQREASRQQRLAHPNIVTVHDFDRVGDVIFITMELLEGTPLDEYIKSVVVPRGGLSFDEALPIIRNLGSALSYAHGSNIIHSDFKPSNCFLTANNDVKILDFGIARAVRTPDQQEQTVFDGSKLGAITPSYASCEMLESLGDPHPGDDVYALACVSYELLTGKHPYGRLPANVAEENGLKPAPVPKLSRSVNRALARGLAFRRENRTPSAEEFVVDLAGKDTGGSKIARIAGYAGAAAVLSVIGYFGLAQYREHQQESIVEGVVSADPSTVAAAIAQISTLEANKRWAILNEPQAKDRIVAYFADDIEAKAAAFDFDGVNDTLNRARAFYSDSARIENAAERAVEQKNRLLGELSETYETLLRTKNLLPDLEGDDIPDVIERLKKIDPQHNLLTDSRLASTYAQEADRLIGEADFKTAASVINVGQLLAPGNPALINAQDRLTREQAIAEVRARSRQLAARLEPAVAAATSLEAYLPLAKDLATLYDMAPENPVMVNAREKIAAATTERLAALGPNVNLNPIGDLERDYAPLLAAIGLAAQSDQITDLYEQVATRIEQLANSIADAIALGRLDSPPDNNARTQIAALRAIAPDDVLASELEEKLVSAYISRANDDALAGNWDAARNEIALARREQVPAALDARLQSELEQINSAEQAAKQRLASENQRKAEEEKRARIADLERGLIRDTETVETIGESRQVLQKLNQLAALAPNNPLLQSTRDTLAEKLSAAALAKGTKGADWDAAMKEITNVASLFPDSAPVAEARERVETERTKALALAKESEINGLKDTLTKLAAAKPDEAWSKNTSAALANLAQKVPADDPWLAQMRDQLTAIHLSEAQKLQTAQRFTMAGAEIDYAQAINPGAPAIKKAREELDASLAEYKIAQREKNTAARIKALKQTFVAHIKSKQLASAKKTLASLKQDLPPDDAFIAVDAPVQIAGIYLDFANSKISQKDYAAAMKFAESGLEYDSKNAQLTTALQTAKGELAKQKTVAAARQQPVTAKPEPAAAKPVENIPAPAPPVPTQITEAQVFGKWCGDNVQLSLAADNLTYYLPGGTSASYAVRKYDFGPDTFTIEWSDKQRGAMETEFGGLASDNSSLVQLRGRSVAENKWNEYNRPFRRCK